MAKKPQRVRKRRPCKVCSIPISMQGSTGMCRNCAQANKIEYEPDEDEIYLECMRIRAEGGGQLHPYYRNREWEVPSTGRGHRRKGKDNNAR